MSESPLAIRKEAWSGGDTRLAKAVARPLVRFLEQETASGVLLLAATAAALIWANVAPDNYHSFWESGLDVVFRTTHLFEHDGHALPLHLWVNDVLMVLFFFVAGLEIKSELVVGDLSDPKVAALPAIAALGGMLLPALIFYGVNIGGSGAHGWGVPMATDIAFAVGVLALLGPRVPFRLKLFLLTLAIADDIGAILVIAIFYSSGLSFQWLAAAVAGLVVVALLKKFRVWYIPVYIVVGVFVWYCTFRSGIHATIAGVALGLMAPARPLLGPRAFENIEDIVTGERATPAAVRDVNWKMKETVPITSRLITLLSPFTGFIIVPLFAVANAGVLLSGDVLSNAISNRVMWGVILGLVVGKPLGITLFTMAAVRLGIADMPRGVSLIHVLAAGAVAGIGFTVALFIGGLAFEIPDNQDAATIGILAASFLATLLGAFLIRLAPAPTSADNVVESDHHAHA
ncbi:MAG: Na+/H+ antiporter NhaA [Acidimicrobiales bacterium]